MKPQTELEDLFAAAQRQKKDAQRQQQLSEFIDQLAAKEAAGAQRRHRIWAITGIAASFLLLIGIGHYTLSEHGIDREQKLVAENKTEAPQPTPDNQPTPYTPADSQHTTLPTRHLLFAPQRQTTPDETDSIQTIAQPESIEEEQIVPIFHPEPGKQVLVAENHEEHKVFTRTSSRLVCGSGCQPKNTQKNYSDAPQLAVINLSGTGTEFELTSISF